MSAKARTSIGFEDPDLAARLAESDAASLDALDFGVIGFDRQRTVRLYNRPEAEAAGLSAERVVGRDLFVEVAPCMNNFMVAQRFVDAWQDAEPLDATIDYVLTLRMKPTPVKMRLIVGAPESPLSLILIRR